MNTNIDIINVVTIMSVIITMTFLIHTVLGIYREKRKKKYEESIMSKKELTDYQKILHATYGIEKEREKNNGRHFEDEAIYLNRAEEIRLSSSFFTWVNEK